MPPRVDGTSPAPLYDYNENANDTYVVQGETSLVQIAEKFHLDRDALAEANPQIKDGTKLLPFQAINLPQCSTAAKEQAGHSESSAGQPSSAGGPPGPVGDPVANSAIRAKLDAKTAVAAGAVPFARTAHPEELARTARPEELAKTQPGGVQGAGNTQADGLAGRAKSASGASGAAGKGSNLGDTGAAGPDTKPPVKSSVPGEKLPEADWGSGKPWPADAAHPPTGISVDEALTKAKAMPENVLPRGTESQQWVWEKVEGQTGRAPAAFEVNDGIHPPQISIDYERLSAQQLQDLKNARAGTAAARAARAGAGAAPEGAEAIDKGAGAAEKQITKKGVGVGDTVADGVGKARGAVTRKGMGVGEEVTQKGVGVAEDAAAEAAAEAGEEGVTKLAGAGLAIGEAVGFVGFMLEPFQMMGNYFGAFEEAKNAMKSRGYTDGFSQGVAAGMKGVPQDDIRAKFGREVANTSTEASVVGAEGVEDRFHNKGLVDGYKYFQSLPPEKQQQLRDAATKNGWDLKKDDVEELERGIRPMVQNMFEKVAEAERKAAEEKARKMMGLQ